MHHFLGGNFQMRPGCVRRDVCRVEQIAKLTASLTSTKSQLFIMSCQTNTPLPCSITARRRKGTACVLRFEGAVVAAKYDSSCLTARCSTRKQKPTNVFIKQTPVHCISGVCHLHIGAHPRHTRASDSNCARSVKRPRSASGNLNIRTAPKSVETSPLRMGFSAGGKPSINRKVRRVATKPSPMPSKVWLSFATRRMPCRKTDCFLYINHRKADTTRILL